MSDSVYVKDQQPAAVTRIVLAGWEIAVLVLVLLLGVAMAVIGLVSSYAAVAKAAADHWGWGEHAWMLPVAVDASIIGFGLGHLFLIRFERKAAWVRLLPVLLTTLTIWLNWNTGSNTGGKVSHAGVVIVWVGFTEYVAHLYSAHIAKLKGIERDEVPASRWFLSPYSTAVIARQMRLWDLTYSRALELARQRRVYQQRLTQRHGKWWRWKADADERMPLRMVRWGMTVEEALSQPGRDAAADALRAHEAGVRTRELALRVAEEEATEALAAVERQAAIASARARAEAERLFAEAERTRAEQEARTAADTVVRRHELEVQLQKAKADAEADRLRAEAAAEAAKATAQAEAEAAEIRTRTEEAQLKARIERDRLERQAAEDARLAALETSRRQAEAAAEQARRQALADAEQARLAKAKAEAEQAKAEAVRKAAVAEQQAAVALEAASVTRAKAAAVDGESERRAAEDKRLAALAEAEAAELKRAMAVALDAAAVAHESATRSPAERQALIVADLIERFGEDKVTLSYIEETLGVTGGTRQDRRNRARQILAERRTQAAGGREDYSDAA
ncbi:DUF2637 domain-containing protein [Kitasatospora purpeofusca]|uniref:DUF2637 domain-containing protein n=1 Tax=Kitasatospora purpeofusca TaxID=67352 RepID=UPI0022526DA0|nr:DUF2637 domain-containing protein [Kitasatospora purpeofusca]MCX4690732.1 DUF2637 domain-containing protein [Kitasatospora purpeofusca]